MSTPSTATAILPPHRQFYPHHQPYPMGNPSYGNDRSSGALGSYAGLIRPTSSATHPRPSNHLPPIHTPNMPPNTRKSQRKTDWNDFYKNGIPKEVIVIEDSSPEPDTTSGAQKKVVYDAPWHADKKRKTNGTHAYDPVYNAQSSYSSTQTPFHDNSSAQNTTSTDRTAPTSIGTSMAGSYLNHYDDSVVGQKRKRTRNLVAEEAKAAKRREKDRMVSPYSQYIPPPKPPIKAREVNVNVVHDKTYSKEKVDDDDGHYIVTPESNLTERYVIQKLLGQGTFGKVVEAYDRRKRTHCAIKIIRSVQKYRDASRIELRVLSTLYQNDKENRNRCIHLRDCFDFRNHICIVTDLYGQSVFDFLKSNNFTPFPNTHIQLFARQLLTSVAFLHDLNLIHTDLKPENILLVDNTYQTFTYNRTIPSSSSMNTRQSRHRKVLLNPEIRLIDFGSATFNDEYHSSVVSTRHYRAPEIILNLGWSFPCDLWSIGCILVEFFTGDALFQTHDNLEHLAMMEPVCDKKLDRDLITRVLSRERSTKNPAASYFNPRQKKLDYPNKETARNSRKYVNAMKKLQDTIPQGTEFNRQFLDLLMRIFVYNPDHRITAKEALRHPWFKETLQDDGTEAARIRDVKVARRAAQEYSDKHGRHRS